MSLLRGRGYMRQRSWGLMRKWDLTGRLDRNRGDNDGSSDDDGMGGSSSLATIRASSAERSLRPGFDICTEPVADIAKLWAHKGAAPDPGALGNRVLQGPHPKDVGIWTDNEDQIDGLTVDLARRCDFRSIPQGEHRVCPARRLYPQHQVPPER